jgi:hypothetical protein
MDTLVSKAATSILFIFVLMSCKEKSYDESHTNIFEADVNGKKIYIHKYTWGLSGNHSDIVVSLEKIENKKIDVSKDILYKGNSIMFYKVKNDTLFLLVETIAEIPKDFSNVVKVLQEEKSNRDLNILRETYSEQNLNKVGE